MNVNPVTLSAKAAEEVKNIMKNKNIPEGYGLRIGVKGGLACAGANYMLGFDKPRESDLTYEISEIPIFIEKKHMMYLIGMQVDFYEGSDARGFTFNKPEKLTSTHL